jgi:hypothetical protein
MRSARRRRAAACAIRARRLHQRLGGLEGRRGQIEEHRIRPGTRATAGWPASAKSAATQLHRPGHPIDQGRGRRLTATGCKPGCCQCTHLRAALVAGGAKNHDTHRISFSMSCEGQPASLPRPAGDRVKICRPCRRALPAIIDLEASGFGKGSYPIEVGFVLPEGAMYCTLIQPAPHWRHWDDKARGRAPHHPRRAAEPRQAGHRRRPRC